MSVVAPDAMAPVAHRPPGSEVDPDIVAGDGSPGLVSYQPGGARDIDAGVRAGDRAARVIGHHPAAVERHTIAMVRSVGEDVPIVADGAKIKV
jgi:hypothetical protein